MALGFVRIDVHFSCKAAILYRRFLTALDSYRLGMENLIRALALGLLVFYKIRYQIAQKVRHFLVLFVVLEIHIVGVTPVENEGVIQAVKRC